VKADDVARAKTAVRPGPTREKVPAAPGADTRRRVLLIEDENDIAEAISYQLERTGLQGGSPTRGEGLEAVRKGVDLVLLDLNLPGMDGLEVCRMIRRQQTTAHVPIIIVSARADEVDRVLGLEMGADDYVVKPFSLKELAARARVALRRTGGGGEAPQGYRDENWEIEFDSYVVRYRGDEIRLTHKEFELFRYMVERPGRVLTRERLLERVWGWEPEIDARSIDAHIRRLRRSSARPGTTSRLWSASATAS
jgi:DNA-binding response OmpR family regulator